MEGIEGKFFKADSEKEKMKGYLEDYLGMKEALIRAAAITRNNAVSHRPIPFKVGCSLMAKDLETRDLEGEYAVTTAYNFKPENIKVAGEDKRCAERNAIDAALNKKLETIVALVTVSEEISTGDSSKACTALHPCRDCRDMLRDLRKKGILKGESVILNVNDRDGKITEEERTADELLALYEDDLNEDK